MALIKIQIKYLQRLKEEIQNAFDGLDKEDLDALYGTLLEIDENITPYLK